MPCTRVDLGDGTFAIACTRGRKPRRCAYCSAPGTQLCDHVVGAGSQTCDTPVCREHAHHVEPDRDYCRAHLPAGGSSMTTPTSLFDINDPPEPEPEPEPDHEQPRQVLLVWSRSRFSAECRSCHQPMTMAQLVSSGKWMPFDADPVALRTSHDPQTHKMVDHLDAADVHFRTCPHASQHRREHT